MKRIVSIDFTRGLVMLIMAIDHIRDLMHVTALSRSPTDLTATTPALFFTRWITHLCAPAFVFLAGTSAFLFIAGKPDQSSARKFLISRGLWLILLEFTFMNFGLNFDLKFRLWMFSVIAAIGSGLILLSLLSRLSSVAIGLIGMVIIFAHNLLPGANADGGPLSFIYTLFFRIGLFQISASRIFFVAYPIIPWLGIMLIGYASGKFFLDGNSSKRIRLFQIGAGALLLFVIIRYLNFYGDPVPWSIQPKSFFTFLSFINTTKYPPSLLFILMTLGIVFLILYFSYTIRGPLVDIVSIYGKVPLFYYIVHFYLIHIAAIIMLMIQGYSWNELSFAPFRFGRPEGLPSGIGLKVMYLVWVFTIIIMYPLCKWYGNYKFRHPEKKFLKYL